MPSESSPARPVVVGLGEVLWDRFPDGDRLGGAPANVAYTASRLGAEGRIASRVGADEPGRRLKRELAARGLPVDDIQDDPALPTGSVAVELLAGQPRYVIATPAAWDALEFTPAWERLAARADAVCFGTLARRDPRSRAAIGRFLERVPRRGVRLFDLNLRQSFYDLDVIEAGLRAANALKLNEEEGQRLAALLGAPAEAVIARLFEAYPLEWIALTRGAAGCELHSRGETVRAAAPPVACVDAVGAGDAFTAALLLGLAGRRPLREIAERANRLGAHVASRPGAMVEIPPGF